MNPQENNDDLELPAAKKVCLDNNDVSNSLRNNSSLSDSTLHLGNLYSPRQSLSSCNVNDGVDNNTVSTPNKVSDGNECIIEDKNKGFSLATSETDDKTDECNVISDSTPECVKSIENDTKDSSVSKLNVSTLSTKAFNIDESIDFMDETCFEYHSDDQSNENPVSVDVKCPKDLSEISRNDDQAIVGHELENSLIEGSINLSKKSSSDCSDKLEVTLDYTCKPDVISEETSILCHSTIKKDATSPSSKLFLEPSLTSMSIDESLVGDFNNIPCQPTEGTCLDLISKKPLIEGINFEDNGFNKMRDDPNSTNLFNEVSGCVLDYTCSRSDGFDVNETCTDVLANKVTETSIIVMPECYNTEQQDGNKSDLIKQSHDMQTEDCEDVKPETCLNLEENNLPEPENPINDLYDLSDLKNSFISNKTFSTEEVNFLKENLLKVMELLKSDNASFESYKVSSENEKRELLEKIKYLESNSAVNHTPSGTVLNSQEMAIEQKIVETENYNSICEELSNVQKEYNNLLQLVLVTESNWVENTLFVNFLNDLNIALNELFIPLNAEGDKFVINHKKIYDLMLSLSKEVAKSNAFKEECIHILRYYESTLKQTDRLHISAKECDYDFVDNLKATFEGILKNKNYLENENTELKKEVCNKSDEIKILSSTIEKLNEQLNGSKSTRPEDKYGAMETSHNLSLEETEKLINDSLNESNVNMTDLKESIVELKKALSLSEENCNNLSLKCEKYELELQKTREFEQVNQGLLLQYNGLKTEVDSKYSEIEKLNSENQKLIYQIEDLKLKYEIKNQESDTNIGFETSQKSFLDIIENTNEALVPNDQYSKNSPSKNGNIGELSSDEEHSQIQLEKIQNNLSMKEKLVELKENNEYLDIQSLSSEDEVSKLQLELHNLNERYSEILSNFDLYKQTYTRTEVESNLLIEEKQSLECELESLKSQLECAQEDFAKLKSQKEEINNNLKNIEHQLCEGKQISRDIQNSYEGLKTKYEESLVEVDNKTLELKNVLSQLSELETTNANLRIQLSSIHINSDQHIISLQNEISELKIKCETSEKLLIDLKEKYDELKVSYDKMCEVSESKNADLSLLNCSKEQLELLKLNEALLKQKISDLEEEYNSLEAQFCSTKNEAEKLKSDLENLKTNYSEVVSDFDDYKKAYTHTEEESSLWKEEKQLLECQLDSLKSLLESAYEESSKLKSDNEEIDNELRKVLHQLSDFEKMNDNLRTQLSGIEGVSNDNEDLLNNQINELKIKCETSEKLLSEQENIYSELKVSFDKIWENLETKNLDLALLISTKDQLEKDLEIMKENETSLKQSILDLEEDRNGLENQLLSSKEEVSKLQLDLDCLKENYTEMSSDFAKYKETYTFTDDECSLLKEEKHSLVCELDSLKSQLKSAHEESLLLKSEKEEISSNLKTMENELCEEKLSRRGIQESYDSLKTQYEEYVVEIIKKNLELQNALTQLSDLEKTNANLKNELSSLHSDSENNLGSINREVHDLEILNQSEALLREQMMELQEDRKDLESRFLSAKEESSKLQLDLDSLKEKYTEMSSDFVKHKEIYTCTNDEYNLLKEEKQSLECVLDSLKSQLGSSQEESAILKSEKDEINNSLKTVENQLSEEKLHSKEIQESYENIKTKYEESVNDVNNKAIELQNLLERLTEFEKHNADLKNELSSVRSDYEHNIDVINQEVHDLKRKCEATEKLLIDQENIYSELKVSYDKMNENLETKNEEIALLTSSKEQLEKELELLSQNETSLKQKILDLGEDCNDLESRLLSAKEESSKLQLDLDCLKEKYSKIISDFDLYKQSYTHTKDDYNLLKEDKHSLKCELDSLKSLLECAQGELEKMKSEKEEINNYLKTVENQLSEEKLHSKEIQESYESIKTKYEESVDDVNNKAIELRDLQARFSELEETCANLNRELSNICSNADINVDLLNKEISELKMKCDCAEKLSVEHEKKYSDLKITYDNVLKDLETITGDLAILISSKEELEKQLEFLNQKILDMQEDRNGLETQFLSSKEESSKLQLDLDCLKEKYSKIVSDFDIYKQSYTHTKDESSLWNEEKQSLECVLDSLKSQLESSQEESAKLKSEKDEINNNLKTVENQLFEEKLHSKEIQESYENIKTKYEESVNDVNNKAIELQSLLERLTEFEKNNADLKNELSSVRSDSEHNIDAINQEVHDLKRKCEVNEKLLIDHEKMYNEIKVSYDKVCEELESKRVEVSLLTECKEKLEKDVEILNQNEALLREQMMELQEDRKDLESRFLSAKEESSKLQLDLDSLKEKYTEMSSDFVKYKEIYTCTNDEYSLLKEEKHSLKYELDSLKSELESAHEESSKLKSEKEDINNNLKNIKNQLSEAMESSRNIANDFENLKTKYEESVVVNNNKTVEIQNLLGQLSDLEASHGNLKSELDAIRSDSEHNMDLLSKEILELKGKCENSEKLFGDLEEKHNELKVSYNQMREDFESKEKELSLLSNCKAQLEKEFDTLTENNFSCKQKIRDLEINEESHKKEILDLNTKLDSAYLKIRSVKNIEIQIGVLKDEYYDILSLYCNKDKEICDEQSFCLISEFVKSVEAIIKDLLVFKSKCSEDASKLTNSAEEIARLNAMIDSLKEEIKLSAEDSDKLQANYSSLSKQYNTLLDASKDSSIRCNSLLEDLKELESQNSLCKSTIEDLKSEITGKESIIVNLSNMKELYESAVKENETLSSKLAEKIEEYEKTLGELKNSEDKYLALKDEHSALANEINDLRNKNELLEIKSNENYALYMSVRDNIEILQKEKEEIRKNFIKCEKDYQNSLDLVKKNQENMGNLDKQYSLSMAKLNAILKEKESYENQNLSLQKMNDELVNRIKEVNSKCLENQTVLMKFRELEKAYEVVSSKHQSLEKQLVDYGNLKRENEILKTRFSEKDSFANNLSTNFNALKEKYNSSTDELKSLSTAVLALLPGENSAMDVIKLVGDKLQVLKKVEDDLEEQKMKCQNLDEECNLLNEDLNYKDVVIGDMYKDHSSQMNELKESLKKEENLRQEILLENSTLKDKIKCLDSEIIKLKTAEQSVCKSCVELKGVLQKLKMDLVDNSSKVTTLQLQIEENEITHKKKIHDYRKKISSLQEELGAALNKLEDNRLKNEIVSVDASSQTESLPIQISGQSGIVQSFKIKEQEEKIHKYEKENLILKRMCQSRLQTIQDLKTKLENVSKSQKTQRNVLEEVQNHQSS